jgi:hypothetical protein
MDKFIIGLITGYVIFIIFAIWITNKDKDE